MKKLVRDLIKVNEEGSNTRPVEDTSEFLTLLFDKVTEELGELAEAYHSGKPEQEILSELGDLRDVITGIEFLFIDRILSCPNKIYDDLRKAKLSSRGGFYTGVVLETEEEVNE